MGGFCRGLRGGMAVFDWPRLLAPDLDALLVLAADADALLDERVLVDGNDLGRQQNL